MDDTPLVMGSTPPTPPPPPTLLLKRRNTFCFLCGWKDFVNEVPSTSSSGLLYPCFPIPTTAQLPQGIRVCRNCEYIFVWIKEITHAKENLRRAVSLLRFNQEVFQEDEDVRELRRLIMFPCDFGWPSSTFGFNQEDVAGDFGKLPNELLDHIFSYLDPTSLKNLRQVSSFMRNKTFPQIHVKCPIKILKWIECDNGNFITWPHLKNHGNLEVNSVPDLEGGLAEDRLIGILREGEAVKKLTLRFDSVRPGVISKILNAVFTNLPKLEELDLYMDINRKKRYRPGSHIQLDKKHSWFFWTTIKPSLKKVILRSPIPHLKDFLQATPNVSSVLQHCNDNKLLDLLKRNGDEDIILWPQLESISMINIIDSVDSWPIRNPPPQNIVDSLGPRPIKQLKIDHVEYPNLQEFVQLLQEYGDTLEWVEVVMHLNRHTFSSPYEEMDLPTNLKRLRGFKITIRDLPEEGWNRNSGYRIRLQEMERQCTTCNMVGMRLREWQHPRDFLRVGELLKDPTLFHVKFPELRQLSLLVTRPPTPAPIPIGRRTPRIICPTCVTRKQAICESLVPPQASNPYLRVVELSHPTEEENPALYSAWRTRLSQAFPNAKIERPS